MTVMYFFFNDTATTEIYTLSLHDALPILDDRFRLLNGGIAGAPARQRTLRAAVDWSYGLMNAREQRVFERLSVLDRKSTRLNSSHANISYAVFCLKKKNHPPQHLISRALL